MGFSGIMGGATASLGGQVGKAIGADKWFGGIQSPLLQNTLRGVTSNSLIGAGFGGLGALADNDPNTTFWDGAWSGAKMGATTGTISGIGAAAQYSATNKVNLLTGKPNTVKESGNYTVYRGIDPETDEVKYIGITERDPELRFNEHKSSDSPRANLMYEKIEGATNLSKIDARIMEQNYINQYRMIKNGGSLYNQRNSIAPKFWYKYNIKR